MLENTNRKINNMKKQLIFNNISDIVSLKEKIVEQVQSACNGLFRIISDNNEISAMQKIKFQKTMKDMVFDEEMNFIEYLNQTFTYLVCLTASQHIMEKCALSEIVINLGVQSGFDVASVDESIVCECFSTTTVKSNDKLKKDVNKVLGAKNAIKKYVCFYSENYKIETAYVDRISKMYPNVMIVPLSMKELIE